jgi:hypothetical protein
MSKENFKEEEIVWAKLKGYPWWPAILLSIKTEINTLEEKYRVLFFGNYVQETLKQKYILKFDIYYKQFSKSKNKDLTDSIAIAKEIYDSEEDEKSKKIKEIIAKAKPKDKDKKNKMNDSSSETSKTKEKSKNDMGKNNSKKKLKKNEDKLENDLIYKICNYLRHITAVLVKKDNSFSFEKNKEYLCKIFKFLSEYQMQEPIEFLKKSNLGKYIKYINNNVNNNEIKQASGEVYKSLENQVLNYLLKQK